MTASYEKYAELRDAAGITDYEVAKSTGLSTATLTNWKKTRYRPKVDKLIVLAKYFGVNVEDFLSDEEVNA